MDTSRRRWTEWIAGWLDGIRRSEHQLTLALGLVVGALVGLTVVAFLLLTGHLAARMYPADAAAWRRLVVPVAGSLVSAWLLARWFPLARGSGIPQTKFALFIGGGVITLRTVIGKFVCCSTSLASGIALGREGPSVHIGAGLASVVGRRVGLSREQVQALIPLGGSAALAAAFNTPIAGVLFALEEIVGDLHAPILGGAVLSSATAWMILHAFLGDEPLFHVAGYQLVHPSELALYAVLGVAGGLVSVAFVKLLLALRLVFLRRTGPLSWLFPVVGGVTVGAFGYFVPEALGVGYDHIERILNGDVVLRTVLLLCLLKVLATATSYASGNAGGIFGPSLFIGAMVGGAVGSVAHGLLPATTAQPGAYAVVGMGTAFAGIVRTPLTSVIMIFELTRDYTIIVPLMISNLLAYYVSHRLQPVPIYEALTLQEGIHLPSGDSRGSRSTTVAAVLRPVPPAVSAGCTIAEAAAAADAETLEAWPAVDARGFVAMVPVAAIRDAIEAGRGGEPVLRLAGHPRTGAAAHLHPDHDLPLALERMRESGGRLLPVLRRADIRGLVGLAAFSGVIEALGTTPAEAPEPEAAGMPPVDAAILAGTLGLILAGVAALATADAWLARTERAQNAADARRAYDTGQRLEAAGDARGAAERYRQAVALARGDRGYAVAFARASIADGRIERAEATLADVLRRHHADGEASLLMARAEARRGHPDDALTYYHRAIYGTWDGDALAHSTATRVELIEQLARRGPSRDLLAELLLLEQSTDDPAIVRRVAGLYLDAGAPDRAIDAWERLLRSTPRDPSIHVGLGEAQLAAHRYRSAYASFRAALRLAPDDARPRRGLALASDVQSLDPTARGLDERGRYARSVTLLERVGAALERCGAGAAPGAAVLPTRLDGELPSVDATERNLDEAERLWRSRGAACNSPDTEALTLVVAGLGQ